MHPIFEKNGIEESAAFVRIAYDYSITEKDDPISTLKHKYFSELYILYVQIEQKSVSENCSELGKKSSL